MVENDAHSLDLIRLYKHYKNKILPYKVGLLEHPAKYLDAMETIDGLINK